MIIAWKRARVHSSEKIVIEAWNDMRNFQHIQLIQHTNLLITLKVSESFVISLI